MRAGSTPDQLPHTVLIRLRTVGVGIPLHSGARLPGLARMGTMWGSSRRADDTVTTQSVRMFRPVRVSFVLRVDPEYLATGRVVGEIEDVSTGRRGGLRGVEDILSFCSAAADTATGTRTQGYELGAGGHT